jgi:recombination protein RecA
VVKNKVSPPFKQADFEILYGEGVSFLGELVDLGVEYGFVQKSGSWYSYNNDKIGQGKDNAKLYLKENPEKAKELEAAIREKAFAGRVVHSDADVDSDDDAGIEDF